jgi:uncharacterized protein (DUF1684 family)
MSIRSIYLAFFLVFSACTGVRNDKSPEQAHLQWQQDRLERLKSGSGWLNLAGLYWLEEGENAIGSDSSNNIIFPKHAPAYLGKYILKDSNIVFLPDTGVLIPIKTDISGQATNLKSGSLAWFIIEREGRYAIRLRDYEHPAIEAFQGIESFPFKPEWRIRAAFEEFDSPRELSIPTVMGSMENIICPGLLRFKIRDQEHVLYPSPSGDGFFIVFADGTSGVETYGGGRFLYTDGPGKDGSVLLDFNRAYNPPCAFTPYATCPLPPRENILSVRIESGEKDAGH